MTENEIRKRAIEGLEKVLNDIVDGYITNPNAACNSIADATALLKKQEPELEMLFHIPNGGSRNLMEAAHLKAQGVKPGVPDICLPVPRGKFAALYIELKRRKRAEVSDYQRGWITALNRVGNRAVVCYGWDEAREALIEYLKGVEK